MIKFNIALLTLSSLLFGCTNNTYILTPGDIDDNPGIATNLFPGATGEVPVVAFMVHRLGGEAPFVSVAEVERKYLTGEYNVRDYFAEVSGGRFTPTLNAIIGPYTIDINVTAYPEKFRLLTAMAERDGFDFWQFDTNGNGTLERNEVIFSFVESATEHGGQTAWAGGAFPSGLRYSMFAANHGSFANLATIVHEISHVYNTWDLYGSDCNSYGETVMSCTITGGEENESIHLDPWHKINLGWVRPRYINVSPEQSGLERCYALSAPTTLTAEGELTESHRPLLVYEDYMAPNEYFLIEYRRRGTYDDVWRSGVGLWTVRVGHNGLPLIIPGLRQGIDASVWSYTGPGQRFGNFWRVGTHPQYQDGTPTGWHINIVNDIRDSTDHALVCIVTH
jgi:M6 family metalloprotease-like protein